MKYYFHPLSFLLLVVVLCTGCNNNINTQGTANQVAAQTVLLATIVDEGKPQSVDPSLSMGLHTPQGTSLQPIFSKHGGGVAYSAEKNDKAYVVHNGHPGKMYDAVGAIALSNDGHRIAYGALVGGKWHMVIDGKEGAAFSTVKSPLFSPDGNHLAYQAMSGEKWYLVVDATPNSGTKTRIIDCQFSGDSEKIAYIDDADDKKRGRLVVSDLAFSHQTIITPNTFQLIVNQDGSRFAAIGMRDDKQHIVESSFERPNAIKIGVLYSSVYNPVFGPDGVAVAFIANRDGKRIMVFNDREEVLPDGGNVFGEPVVRPDQKAIGSIISVNNQSYFYQFFCDSEKQENSYDEANGLTYNNDGSVHAYAARKGNSWFIVVNGIEGVGFDRVVSPKFSSNGKYLVYRARKDGRRFVVVANKAGKVIRQHPAYEQVFDVEFTNNGKSLAYGVKDGEKLVWRVETL